MSVGDSVERYLAFLVLGPLGGFLLGAIGICIADAARRSRRNVPNHESTPPRHC
jgi:hypothetical protein